MSDRYAAFLSYSHQLDHTLAPVLQKQIEEIAARWPLQRRVVRVFRDQTNMAASPDLWRSIEEALSSSRWFVLLASPQSAASAWVRDEVHWWLTHRSPERMLIVVTSGTVPWEQPTRGVDPGATNAWPPALMRPDLPQPFWVDLRTLRDSSPRDPTFQEAVARITARVREVDLDRLVGAQRREHRRRVRITAIVAALLVFLGLGAGVATWTATQQGVRADVAATTATAQKLAGAAESAATGRFDLARLLAAHAYGLRPDARSRAALLTALTASPQVAAFVPAATPVTALAVSTDGDEFAVGTEDGTVTVATAAGEVVFTATAPRRITVLALDAEGHYVIAGDEHGLSRWRRGAPAAAPVDVPTSGSVAAAALAPSGERIGLLDYSAASDPLGSRISFLDSALRPGAKARIDVGVSGPGGPVPTSVRLAFSDEETVHIADGPCTHVVVRTGGEVVSTRPRSCSMPGAAFVGATSRTGVTGAFYTLGGATAITDATVDEPAQFTAQVGDAEHLAVSDELDRVAVVKSETVTVATRTSTLAMTGVRGVTAVELLGGSALVVAAEGGAVVFDTDAVAPIVHRTGVSTPDRVHYATRPEVTISPDDHHAAVVGEDGVLTVVALPAGTPLPPVQAMAAGSFSPVAWAADGSSFTTFGADGRGQNWRIEGDHVAAGVLPVAFPAGSGVGQPAGAEYAADGTLRVIDFDGTVVGLRPDGRTADPIRPPAGTLVSALSPGGGHVAYAGDRELVVVDTATGAQSTVVTLTAPGRTLAFPDAGHVLLVQADGRSMLVTLADAAVVDRGSMDPGNVDSTVAAGQMAATLGLDGQLRLTDLTNGQSMGGFDLAGAAPAAGINPASTAVALTSHAETMVTATSGGTVLVWTLDPVAQAELACRTAGHDLTAADWRRVTGVEPPGDLRCPA